MDPRTPPIIFPVSEGGDVSGLDGLGSTADTTSVRALESGTLKLGVPSSRLSKKKSERSSLR